MVNKEREISIIDIRCSILDSLSNGRFHQQLRDTFAPLVIRYVDLMESCIAQSINRGFEKENWKARTYENCLFIDQENLIDILLDVLVQQAKTCFGNLMHCNVSFEICIGYEKIFKHFDNSFTFLAG